MKKIYFITGNESKFQEAKAILNHANIILVKKDLNLSELKTTNQEQVVIDKAKQAYKKIKKPLLVDDTAIYFSDYKDFPGTSTKLVFQAIGFKGIFSLLSKTSKKAYFKNIICYKDNKTEEIFSGIWNGKIIPRTSKKFNPNWQYDSIFIPDNMSKPLSELSLEERSKLSHRRKSLNKLLNYFKKK